MFHIVINGCHNVKVQGVTVSASGNSPNTDGIHVQLSSSVAILNSWIGTGDDCISIGAGTSNMWIERVACGPGHGIRWLNKTRELIKHNAYDILNKGIDSTCAFLCSIGSLGKELQEPGVENVIVKSVVFTGTQNGLRIKSWARPSNGFVRNIRFRDAVMKNVQNPIIIDQNYCPNNINCPNQVRAIRKNFHPFCYSTVLWMIAWKLTLEKFLFFCIDQGSGIKVSDVAYHGIWGSSATPVAVKFDCSRKSPCTGIYLGDVNLTYRNQPSEASCKNADGVAIGFVQPSSCL